MQKKRINPPTNLGAAVGLVAKLGGYLGRSNDPPPGHQLIMWVDKFMVFIGTPFVKP